MATFALVTTIAAQPSLGRSTTGEPGRAADRQAFASLSGPANRQELRNPHVDCPTLAGLSGKWSLLDGRSAMATGWFPSLSGGVRGPSHPPCGCSVTRPPTCRVTRLRARSQASILNRFASSLAGGWRRTTEPGSSAGVPSLRLWAQSLVSLGFSSSYDYRRLALKTGLNKVMARNLIAWV